MTPGARLATAIDLLDTILTGQPAGLTLTNWGRRSKFAGSKDRASVRDIVFDCLRRRRSLAHHANAESGRGLVLAYVDLSEDDIETLFTGTGYNPEPVSPDEMRALRAEVPATDSIRLDFPDFLDGELRRSLGDDFEPVMHAMISRAPVDLRVNRGKATQSIATTTLKGDDIEAVPVDGVETALRITQNPRRIGNAVAYREGLVELQDASSQAVTLFAEAAPGMKVLDYCAGGGGKALALYDAMRGKGQVVAHDIAAMRMNDLPARAARAGARIAVAAPGHPALKPDSFDIVYVDAPCSGTGSWRRTPDAKWRLGENDITRLRRIQSEILDQAATFVRPGGRLIYATCSILAVENEDQVASFLSRNDAFTRIDDLRLTPLTCGDGFFASKLHKN